MDFPHYFIQVRLKPSFFAAETKSRGTKRPNAMSCKPFRVISHVAGKSPVSTLRPLGYDSVMGTSSVNGSQMVFWWCPSGRSDPYDFSMVGDFGTCWDVLETKNNPKPSGDVKIAIDNGNL